MAANKLRVMHMIGASKPGGAEMFALRLLVAQHKRKDIELLAVVREKSWLEGVLREAGVAVTTVPFGGMFDWRTKGLVKRIAHDFKPQVIQSWMNRATRFVPRPSYSRRWATVARLGGFYDLKYYRGRVHNLIGNTQAICDYCIAHGWKASAVEMISNFIPEPAIDWKDDVKLGREAMRKKLEIGKDDCVLMMAGRLHKVKGIDVALGALAELPERFKLLLVGEGPLREDLEKLAESLHVSQRIIWAGWQDSVTPYAAVADVWLAPSRHEPLGNTVLDAWAHEVPVIASRTGGLEMLLADGNSGILVEVGDVDALRDAVLKLEGNAALRKRMVKGGLKVFSRDYSEDGIVGKYVAYYQELGRKD